MSELGWGKVWNRSSMDKDSSRPPVDTRTPEPPMTELALYQALWNAAFKLADIAFKLVSWALILGLFKLLYPTQNTWFRIVSWILNSLFGIVVFLAAFMLLARHPKDFGFHGTPVYFIKIIMIALFVFTLGFGISPSLEMDKLIDALMSGRTQNHPSEPVVKTGAAR